MAPEIPPLISTSKEGTGIQGKHRRDRRVSHRLFYEHCTAVEHVDRTRQQHAMRQS